MSSRLALYFLGPPRLFLDNAPINAPRRKAIALLAYLSIEQGQHQREVLSALLWPDYEQAKAFTNLRHTLWEIQQSIGEGWLMTDRERIGLKDDADLWLDVRQFESMLAQIQAQNKIPLRIPLLVESINLYRNHFMTGFGLKDALIFNEWAFAKSEDLRCQLAGALIRLSEDYCTLGQADHAIPYARRLITLDALNESAHRRLMNVYWLAGQHSAALKQYQICEEILRKELNLDPGPETYALYKQIRKGEAKPAQTEKQKDTVAPEVHPLSQPSTIIDREKEQDMLEIRSKIDKDPATELYVPDAYLRWMLLAAEEMIGKLGLRVVLRKASLEHIIGNYPNDHLPKPSRKFTFGDESNLNAALIDFCERHAESQMREMGRVMVKYSLMEQGSSYGIATISFPKFASLSTQLKMAMDVIVEGVRRASQSIGQDHRLFVEDRGDRLAYIVQDCVFCAGKESNHPICMFLTGNLQGGLHWLTGEEFYIEEVECRATGAKACIWEIHKEPKKLK